MYIDLIIVLESYKIQSIHKYIYELVKIYRYKSIFNGFIWWSFFVLYIVS